MGILWRIRLLCIVLLAPLLLMLSINSYATTRHHTSSQRHTTTHKRRVRSHKKSRVHGSVRRHRKKTRRKRRVRKHKALHAKKRAHKKTAIKTKPKRPPLPPRYFVALPSQIPVSGMPVESYAKFEHKLKKFMKKWRLPGASVAVMRQGHVVYRRGFGWANIEAQKPVQPNNLFRVASISKTITAISMMKLVQDKVINLDDKMLDLLDDVAPLPGYKKQSRLQAVRVRNLLNMTSGWVPRGKGFFDPMFGPWTRTLRRRLDGQVPASCYKTTRMMLSWPSRGRAGNGFSYSNLDYCVLGLLMNRAMHGEYGYQSYETYVQDKVLQPLGISDMKIASTVKSHRQPNEVKYYYYGWLDKTHIPEKSTYLPYAKDEVLKKNFANAGWLATAEDIARVMSVFKSQKVLNMNTVRLMLHRPRYVPATRHYYYAMGAKCMYFGGHRHIIGTGSFTGTNSYAMAFPDGTTVAILFNARPPLYRLFHVYRPQLRRLLLNMHKRSYVESRL